MSLEVLKLSKLSQIIDDFIGFAFPLHNLRSVEMNSCLSITHEGIVKIAAMNPQLEKIYLKDCQMTERVFEEVLSHLKRLYFIQFSLDLSDVLISVITKHKYLKSIQISMEKASMLDKLQKLKPNLLAALPVVMYLWVLASISGFKRRRICAVVWV